MNGQLDEARREAEESRHFLSESRVALSKMTEAGGDPQIRLHVAGALATIGQAHALEGILHAMIGLAESLDGLSARTPNPWPVLGPQPGVIPTPDAWTARLDEMAAVSEWARTRAEACMAPVGESHCRKTRGHDGAHAESRLDEMKGGDR